MASLSSHRLGLRQWGKSHDLWTCLDPQNSDQASRVLKQRPFCNRRQMILLLAWRELNMNKSSHCLNPKHSEHFISSCTFVGGLNILTALKKPCASWQLAENVCYLEQIRKLISVCRTLPSVGIRASVGAWKRYYLARDFLVLALGQTQWE